MNEHFSIRYLIFPKSSGAEQCPTYRVGRKSFGINGVVMERTPRWDQTKSPRLGWL
ncbi:hypothetical protein [Pseudosulfitobacter sp. SM2401]|uniref:hypothetical protein n=1 Tax=Pseudosulfitobacter sp. SM2401 TaxID=3350098 RepID=UPI0036F1A7FA